MVRRLPRDAGFTVIESLVAMTVLLIGLLGVAGFTVVADQSTQTNLGREQATVLARDVLERARLLIPGHEANLNFNDDPLNPGHIGEVLRTALPDAASTARVNDDSFTITRRGVLYTVTATSCLEDEGTDGRWVHDMLFCDEQPPERTPALGLGNVEMRDLSGQSIDPRLLNVSVGTAAAGTTGYVNSTAVKTVVCPVLALIGVTNVSLNAVLSGPVNGATSLALRCTGVTGGVVDPVPQDVARVTVKVTWGSGSVGKTVTQSTLISNPQG